MTQSPLPQSDLPASHRWSLWSRENNHWCPEVIHRLGRCEEFFDLLRNERPDLELLILPPGETPLMPGHLCHKELVP